ncbi:Thyrotropin-releasing hormone-degrading ectoenzyme [Dufourea novaeangliae]|uniref:Thyrotropin-releasing hormone-degrading ectoenzyme n=1 Tax=Dufourea novaeangliae TaxID=178035 RepID=A0A154PPN7_DUFNO|nr:Thyrotropin-releasing hormone-degrading ectoenzyme [Dufourea novaeangliae]
MDLLNDEIEDTENLLETLTSPFIRPLKYRLQLMPIININSVSHLKGYVVIEFQVNDTTGLTKLSLNAKNITVARYKLSSRDQGEDRTRLKKKRRRSDDKESSYEDHQDRKLVRKDIYSAESDLLLTVSENETVLSQENTERATESLSADEGFETSSSKDYDARSANHSDVKEPYPDVPAFSSSEIAITQYIIDDDKEIHTIFLETPIQEGIYLLEIDYHTWIDDNAFFIANYTASDQERWLMGTKLKRFGARYLLPVFDDTDQKVVFSVSVARPKEMSVLSNMPLRTLRDTVNSTMVIDTFDESPPLSPHNLAFLMGHIENMGATFIGGTKVVATFWSDSMRRSQGIYLFDKLEPAVINLIDVFPIPYALPKLDLVSLPPGIDESVASPGLIAIKQSAFFTTDMSPLVTKNEALKALVTLFGQQLLDEFMNVNRTDAWLFEGSLIYFQHEIDSSLNLSNSFVTDVQMKMMDIDSYSISRAFHENINYRLLQSFNDEYAKSACLIRMLHGAISDTAFRNGYRKLVTRWKNNTTYVLDFMTVMAEESSDLLLPSGVTLEESMNSWARQGGYPLVTVIRNYDEDSLTIYQEQFTLDRSLEDVSKFWYIPLSYVTENGSWSSPMKVFFPSEPQLSLDNVVSNESWILFNVNKTGYYRVHYDDRNWMMLKSSLQVNHELFPAETRASLIDDVFSLAAVGLMKYETVFDFIKYMQIKERHYLPWTALMRHAFKLNRLLYETPIFTDFQEFMMNFVSPLYTEEGSKIKEGSHLTKIAIKMACTFDNTQCLDWVKNVFENSKTDTEMEEIVPSYIRRTFYCTLARYGTKKEWNYFTERVTLIEDEEERKRLLTSFACFQAPWILQSILNEILYEETFHEDEALVILRAFPRNPAAAQVASRFVRANWQEISQKFLGSYSMLKSFVLSMSNGLTTEQDLDDLQAFRGNNYDSMKGARFAAALVEANGNFVTSWLKNSLPEIEKLIKGDVGNTTSIS